MMHNSHSTEGVASITHNRREHMERAKCIDSSAAGGADDDRAFFAKAPEFVRVGARVHAGDYGDCFCVGEIGEFGAWFVVFCEGSGLRKVSAFVGMGSVNGGDSLIAFGDRADDFC